MATENWELCTGSQRGLVPASGKGQASGVAHPCVLSLGERSRAHCLRLLALVKVHSPRLGLSTARSRPLRLAPPFLLGFREGLGRKYLSRILFQEIGIYIQEVIRL